VKQCKIRTCNSYTWWGDTTFPSFQKLYNNRVTRQTADTYLKH